MEKLVAISQSEHAETVTREVPYGADECSLAQKKARDLQVGSPQRFEHADLTRLLNHEGDQGTQDAQGGNNHDEKEQIKLDVLLNDQRVEQVGVFCHPGADLVFRTKLKRELARNPRSLVRVV